MHRDSEDMPQHRLMCVGILHSSWSVSIGRRISININDSWSVISAVFQIQSMRVESRADVIYFLTGVIGFSLRESPFTMVWELVGVLRSDRLAFLSREQNRPNIDRLRKISESVSIHHAATEKGKAVLYGICKNEWHHWTAWRWYGC